MEEETIAPCAIRDSHIKDPFTPAFFLYGFHLFLRFIFIRESTQEMSVVARLEKPIFIPI